jgi:hypothetical protein
MGTKGSDKTKNFLGSKDNVGKSFGETAEALRSSVFQPRSSNAEEALRISS